MAHDSIKKQSLFDAETNSVGFNRTRQAIFTFSGTQFNFEELDAAIAAFRKAGATSFSFGFTFKDDEDVDFDFATFREKGFGSFDGFAAK